MTRQPLTKAEREELRRLHDAATTGPWSPAPLYTMLRICEKSGFDLDVDHLPESAQWPRRDDAVYICESHNALPSLLADLDAAEAERDDAVALIDAAKSDVRPESFLEHAQAILAKCIAPYSCEQMKAVGDALAGCYRKWELMSEVALKAKEDADSMAKCKGCGGTVGDHLAPDQGGCPGSFEIDGVQMVPLAGRDNAVAQRDRAEAERDALIRNINEAFLSLNIPNSTMAFDGRNLLPHAVESARYAEEMRIERDKALADVAKYVDRSESFASAIDHLVSNTADGTDLARITKERDDFRDGMVAMLVAAGAPVDLDAMEAAVLSAGKKPSDFIRQRIRVLTAERDALWVDHRDVVDERDALKAKLAALVDSCRSAETILGNMAKETGRTFGRWEIHHEPLRNDAQRMLPSFRAAIAAAKGGMS